jgi:periplasmic divalent cation tolerance protein
MYSSPESETTKERHPVSPGTKGLYVKKTEFRVVLVTCANLAEAKRIAGAVVRQRLAACVNIITTHIESIYRWKGKIETAKEYLLVMKSVEKCLPELQRLVQELHSYDLPEFIVLPIVQGSKEYLNWISDSVKRKSRP